MRATLERAPVLYTLSIFDGQFAPHGTPLHKPQDVLDRPLLDLLPGVSAAVELQLKNDAVFVYETQKQFDILHQRARNGNSDERRIAQETDDRISQTVTSLLDQISNARQSLENDSILNEIELKLQTADVEIFKDGQAHYMDEWVLNRLSKFNNKVTVGTDVDKTVTTHADYLQFIPGSVQAEGYMAHEEHGRDYFPLVFVRYWREALATSMVKNYTIIGAHVPLREGVKEFFELAEQKDILISIISANFRPFIDGVMMNLPTVSNIYTTRAVEINDITATDKSTVIRSLARNLSDKAFIYFGDGSSDLPAMDEDARKVVACYFALEGSEFAAQLEEAQLPYYTYKDFRDITATFQRLGLFSNSSN